jgi:hypothetical protein
MHEELIEYAQELARYVKWEIEKYGRFKDYLSKVSTRFNRSAEI